ncbi:uncharacterized protein N7483_011688 [Penicillium malachiteum]|uniref:uncharacterized protein n=1 Tax=Penicillium malachiteum TaxID=1324776 RepID=UPI002547BC78|nr:uncharacterized protein N7483_011688 [Penicillium malachiteum]KAJ5714507.1 hypothetical protein N7483_011688 [Penicillium malachiteum]
MGNYARRNEGSDSYLMNQQISVPATYSHSSSHDFSTTGSGSYHYPQHSFNPYGSQFGPSYGQSSSLSNGMHQLQYTSDNAIPSMSTSEDMRMHHSSSQYIPQPRYLQSPRYLPLRDHLGETEIEDQESRNDGSMISEPVLPPLDGFPDVKEFDQLMCSYVNELSSKKQDKALIHATRARNIKNVLMEPKDTAIETAQFRFWVKKMFKLQSVGAGTADCRKMICHEGKPVAIREKLFKILTKAHHQCQHGGRDKTSAQVRRIYSWVPKELISRFVKSCPTCQVRRGGSRLTPPNSRRGSPRLDMMARSPKLPSPPISRRESTFGGQVSIDRPQPDYFTQLHGHGGWVENHQNMQPRAASGLGAGVRSSHGTMGNISHSIAGTMDPFSADLSVSSSQLGYSAAGYVPTYGAPPPRDY